MRTRPKSNGGVKGRGVVSKSGEEWRETVAARQEETGKGLECNENPRRER